MGEVDLRAILVAFAEKGWNLYVQIGPNGGDIDGPIDNIVGGVEYYIMPAMVDPFNIINVLNEDRHARGHGIRPSYSLEGKAVSVQDFIVCPHPEGGIARFAEFPRTIDLPLADAVRLIRENMSEYRAEKMEGCVHQKRQDG